MLADQESIESIEGKQKNILADVGYRTDLLSKSEKKQLEELELERDTIAARGRIH